MTKNSGKHNTGCFACCGIATYAFQIRHFFNSIILVYYKGMKTVLAKIELCPCAIGYFFFGRYETWLGEEYYLLLYHIITDLQGLEGTSKDHQVQLPAKAGTLQ